MRSSRTESERRAPLDVGEDIYRWLMSSEQDVDIEDESIPYPIRPSSICRCPQPLGRAVLRAQPRSLLGLAEPFSLCLMKPAVQPLGSLQRSARPRIC